MRAAGRRTVAVMWWPYLVAGSLRMRDALLVDRASDRVRPATPPRGGGVDRRPARRAWSSRPGNGAVKNERREGPPTLARFRLAAPSKNAAPASVPGRRVLN